MTLKKAGILFLTAFMIVLLGIPIGLYEIGLANIKGRPEPPVETGQIAVDTALLQETFRNPGLVVIPMLNPWNYIYGVVTADGRNLHMDNGSAAVWVVARDYANAHLKRRRRWALSSAALAIWVSRNWTTDQIITAAAAITRKYREHAPGLPVDEQKVIKERI